MKREKLFRAGMLCLLMILVSGCFSVTALAEDKITVMVYMCGSNLESDNGAATADITEMLKSRFDPEQVNVIVMTGGSTRWWGGFPTDVTSVYEVTGNRPKQVLADELLNMGEAGTLSTFLNYGYEQYPADSYALVLWDHGGGPLGGVCWDSLAASDCLSMLELQEALDASPFAQEPLEWIGFDACLMSSVETAYMMAPYAKYMIASQETEPGSGWSYSFLSGIEADAGGMETGQRIVDAYLDAPGSGSDGLTLACINLAEIENVEICMDNFFSDLVVDLSKDTFSALSNMRQGTKGFGRSDTGNSDYDLVDLTDLVQHYSQQAPEEADALLDALQKAIVYNRSNIENSNGLSVYHPYYNKDLYQSGWQQEYAGFLFAPGYTQYIQQFAEIWLGEEMSDWSRMVMLGEEADEENNSVFTMQLTQEQIANFASAQLMVLEEGSFSEKELYAKVYTTDDVTLDENGVLSAKYTGTTLYAVDGEGNPICGPISYDIIDGRYAVSLNYVSDVTDEVAYVVDLCTLNEETDQLEIAATYVYDEVTNMMSNRLELVAEDYEYLLFPFGFRDITYRDDTLQAFDDWQFHEGVYYARGGNIAASQEWHLQFFKEQLTDSDLYATFQVTDTQANTFSSELLTVGNDDVQELRLSPSVVETEEYRIEASATLDSSELSPDLTVTLEVTNLSDTTKKYQLDKHGFVLNGSRFVADADWIYGLEPGKTDEFVLKASETDLLNLDEISSIDLSILIESDEDTEDTETEAEPEEAVQVSLSYELSADVSSFTAKADFGKALAQTESDGVTYQLISLSENEMGELEGVLHCINNTDSFVEKSFEDIAVNGCAMNVSFTPVVWMDAGCDTFESIKIEEEIYLDSFSDSAKGSKKLIVSDPLERWGQTEISDIRLIAYDSPERVELHLDSPLRHEPKNPRQAAPEMKALYEKDGVSVFGETVWVVDRTVFLALELRNETDRDVTLEVFRSKIDGNPAMAGVISESESLVLYADTIAYDYLSLDLDTDWLEEEEADDESNIEPVGEEATEEESEAQTGASSVSMSIKSVDREKKVHLYDLEIEFGTKAAFDVEEGVLLPMKDMKVTLDADALESGQPPLNPEVSAPENPRELQKTLSLPLTKEQAEQFTDGFALVLYHEDNEDYRSEDGEELYVSVAEIPLCVEEGRLTGEYSGMVLKVDEIPDGYVRMNEEISEVGLQGTQEIPSLNLDISDLYVYLPVDFTLTLDYETGTASAENVAVIDEIEGEDYSDLPVSCFTTLNLESSVLGADGGKDEWTDFFVDSVEYLLNMESAHLSLIPAEEIRDNLYIAFRAVDQDGTVTNLGICPYGEL